MLPEITEIKILRIEASTDSNVTSIEGSLNSHIELGWIILDINTYAPKQLTGEYKSNFFCYHLGKLKQKKTII